MELNGKVALVTGASRGIGEYVALELARAGCAVAVCARTEEVKDKRLPGTIHSVAQAIRDAGGKAEGIFMDMRDPESISAGVAKTVEKFGRLDIVVNNAAILVPGTLETIQPRHIDLIWQVDLRGRSSSCAKPFLTCARTAKATSSTSHRAPASSPALAPTPKRAKAAPSTA